MNESDFVVRFLFEELDIRGAFVRLGETWRSMLAKRDYTATVRDLLGEMTATAVLIGSNLKQPGRLSFQLKGHGPIGFLVIDCTEQLHLRGMAQADVKDEDGWTRIELLANTVTPEELRTLPPEALLGRLFPEEAQDQRTLH